MINELLQIQEFKETTRGTGGTPTVKRMGVEDLTIKPMVESKEHKQQRGSLAPAYDVDLTKIEVEVEEKGDLSLEDAPYLLDSVFSIATPSGTGTYTRNYAAPLGTVTSPRIKTLYKGDGTNNYQANGLVVDEFTLTFAKNEALKYTCHYLGTGVATGALAALSDRTVNFIMAQHLALYIDNFGTAAGTTQFTDTFFSGELSVKTNRKNYFGIGAVTPKGQRDAPWDVTLKLTLEFAATSKAYLDAFIAGSSVLKKVVRLAATKSTQSLNIDFAGYTPKEIELFTDEDGVSTVELEFNGLYESTLANYLKAVSINTVAALA